MVVVVEAEAEAAAGACRPLNSRDGVGGLPEEAGCVARTLRSGRDDRLGASHGGDSEWPFELRGSRRRTASGSV